MAPITSQNLHKETAKYEENVERFIYNLESMIDMIEEDDIDEIPDYAQSLYKTLHNDKNKTTSNKIEYKLKKVIEKLDDGIILHNVEVSPDKEGNKWNIELVFSIKNNNQKEKYTTYIEYK